MFHIETRSSSSVTLSRPSSSSSLKIADRSFRYASPCLWNKLPASFRQPNPDHSFSHSSQPNSLSSSVPSSPLSLSITPTFSTLNSKDTFSLNPSRHRPHPFHRTLPLRTLDCSMVLFLVLPLTFYFGSCIRLNWLPVGFWLHLKHLHSDSDSDRIINRLKQRTLPALRVTIACSKGFYKDSWSPVPCSPCSHNMTTEGVGSTRLSDCLPLPG